MKIPAAILLLIGAVSLHFGATFTGLYDAQANQGVVWFDNVLHAAVGVAFALVWLWVLERVRPGSSTLFTLISALFFVGAMAALWELFEVAFYLFFKMHALGLKVYSPTLTEALFDSASNLLGAALWLAVTFRRG